MKPQARSRGGSDVVWVSLIAALVALRILVPLVVIAAAPNRVPLLPSYRYAPLNGDAFGFYETVANLFEAFRNVAIGWIGIAAVVLMSCAAVSSLMLWRAGIRWLAVLVPAFGLSVIVGVLVHDVATSGAGVVGWPLLWALALFPLPALRLPLTPDRAFPPGLALMLIANATSVVATALVGLRATGRRSVGLIAATLFATWPIWVGIVAGHRAWENGQWFVDAGLHLYAEPVSTALVVVALAIALHPRLSATSAAVAGLLLGFSTVVKLSNGPIAAVVVLLVAVRWGWRRGAVLALGGAVSAPIVVGFWSKGYVDTSEGKGGVDLGALYQWRFVWPNARTSTIFTMTMLFVLLPLAVVGVVLVCGWYARTLLVAPILVTIVAYAAYYVTNQHPRFYYVVLPSVFALQAAGAVAIWDLVRQGAQRRAPTSSSSTFW